MAKSSENTCAPLLTSLGFTAESHQSWSLWRVDGTSLVAPDLGRLTYPWQVHAFEVVERKDQLSITKLSVTLSKETLIENLKALVRKYYGPRTQANVVLGREGDVWCVFEFTRPGSREKAAEAGAQTAAGVLLPHGVGGFNVRLGVSGAYVSIIFSDYFGFGYLPTNFASVPQRLVTEALGMRSATAFAGKEWTASSSVYELRIGAMDAVLVPLALQSEAHRTACAELYPKLLKPRTPLHIVSANEPDEWRVVTQGERDTVVLSQAAPTPLEVLEARERAATLAPVDGLILEGKLNKALGLVRERWRTETLGLHLMRRLALLGLSGRVSAEPDFLETGLRMEPSCKLFLSHGVNRALEDGDQTRVLALLSRLGGELMSTIPGGDQLGVFDVVLPELLGDAWCGEDRRKAEDCYQRIIQRRGDLPRILRKLISLARFSGRADQEVAYLARLAQVERRHIELAKINLRLAELRHQVSGARDEACQLALKALKLDRANDRAAWLAAEILVSEDKAEEAIELLDGILRDQTVNLPTKARARLYAMIAGIWNRSMRRPDLAEARYEQAVALDRGNLEVLKELETIYRRHDRVQGLVTMLEAQFDVYEQAGDGQPLRQVFDELVSLYRGVLAQPKRAYELYQRLLACVTVEPEEIDRVLAWRDVEIDWRDLYQRLADKLQGIASGETRARFLCRLADIVRVKLGETTLAVRHLLEALAEAWIDAGSFQFLIDSLSEARDFSTLAACYEQRLEQVDETERKRLLLELLSIPDVLTDTRRDQLAVQTFLLDTQSDKVIHQRLRYYQSIDDVDGIERLIELLAAQDGISRFQQQQWLKTANEVLESCIDERKEALIDRNFRALLETSEDQISLLQDAIAVLKDTRESTRLAFYVAKLLDAEIIPALEERFILKLLSGLDRELALYNQLMSFKATQPEVAATHARIAAALYAKREKQEANTERMLGRLCTLVPCSDEDLDQLTKLAAVTGNHALVANALQKQADLEDVRERKFALLEKLGYVYWRNLKDYGRARLTFGLAMKHAAAPHKLKFLIVQVAADAKDETNERKALADYLMDPATAEDLPAMARGVARLVAMKEDQRLIMRYVKGHVEHALAAGQIEYAGRLAQVLLDNGIVSTDLYNITFRAALEQGQPDRIADAFWRGLACVSDKAQAKAYLSEMRLPLERAGRRDWLLMCFQEALSNNVGDRLGPKTKREILIQYGQLLFETDAKRQKALGVFQDAYRNDPEDNRSWMPLYFLLLEFGTPRQRFEHLRNVVPKLEQDQRPLKNFPLTIESLHAELKELVALVKDDDPPSEEPSHAQLEVSDQMELSGGYAESEQYSGIQQVAGEAPSFSLRGDRYEPSVMPPLPPLRVASAAVPGGASRVNERGLPAVPALTLAGADELSLPDLKLKGAAPRADDTERSYLDTDALKLALDSDPNLPLDAADAEAGLGGSLDLASIHPAESGQSNDSYTLDLGFIPSASPASEASNGQLQAAPSLELDLSPDDVSSVELVLAMEAPSEVSSDGFIPLMLGDAVNAAPSSEASVTPVLALDVAPLDVAPLDVGPLDYAAMPDVADRFALDGSSKLSNAIDLSADPAGDGAARDEGEGDEAEGNEAAASSRAEDPSPLRLDLPPIPQHGLIDDTSETNVIDASRSSLEVPPPPGTELGEAESSQLSAQSGPGTENSLLGHGSDNHFDVPHEVESDVADWRAAVLKGDFNADLTLRLFTQAFASEIEKHIALQAVALVAGNCDRLGNWHWRVWRKPEEYGYPMIGKDRFPTNLSSPILHSSLHKLVITMAPLLVKVFRSRFTLKHVARKLEMTPQQIEKLRKEMSWREGILRDVGFGRFFDRIAERGYRVFNLPGLGSEIFYEGASRCLYLDEAHYRKVPPSHLFHRVLSLLWSIRIHYFVPLALHPTKQFTPVLLEMHQHFGTSGLSRLASRLSSRSPLAKPLAGMDTRQLKRLHEKVGMPSEDVVLQLWGAMRLHVFRLMIAETLDVIGLFEAITNRDLLRPGKHSEIFEMSPYAKTLLDFVTKLHI